MENYLGALDYLIFVITLLICLGIGIYHSVKSKHGASEYFLGNRQFSALPVAISIFMSYISGILILGNTAEVYTNGLQYWLACIGSSIAFLVSAFVYVPFFFKLGLTSSFEYFEARFNSKLVRIWGSITFVISSTVYLGLVMYTPATAISATTGFPTWTTILIAGALSTIYTTMGGIKAVIWTDVFQGVLFLIGLIIIICIGISRAGGFLEVWQVSGAADRLSLFNFSFDPTERLTFWSVIFGRFVISLTAVGIGQTSVQRYSSVRSLSAAKLSCFLNIPAIITVYSLTCFVGLIVFTYYDNIGCDPLANKDITSQNQLLPYFVVDVISYQGISGLFLATLYSGALSSISSSLNSMSACTWEDILLSHYKHLSSTTKNLIIKSLVIFYGTLATVMALLAANLGGNVLQATNSIVGGIGGPSLGMFVLATLIPFVDWKGAFFGSLIGFGLTTWISFGAYLKNNAGRSLLPTNTFNCTHDLLTTSSYLSTPLYDMSTISPTSAPEIFPLYKLSYMYNSLVGCVATVIGGIFISCIASLLKRGTPHHSIEPNHIVPWCHTILGNDRFLKLNTNGKANDSTADLFRSDENVLTDMHSDKEYGSFNTRM